MRKTARDTAFKLIFEYLFLKERRNSDEVVAADAENIDEQDRQYVDKVYYGVLDNIESLTEKIAAYSEGFKTDRIYRVDFAILLLATYELLFCDDIPGKVSANEAVELAKIYSTEKSGAFINGIISSIVKETANVG